MTNEDFYVLRNNKNLETIEFLLDNELPYFCRDYFLAIDSQTSTLTRLNYAHDLKIFFNFLGGKLDAVDFSLEKKLKNAIFGLKKKSFIKKIKKFVKIIFKNFTLK